MAHNSSWPVLLSQYLAARLAVTALTSFDVEENLRTAAAIGRAIHRYDARHRCRATRHLALAFPNMNKAERSRLCVQSFEHFVQLVVEICYTTRLVHKDSWSQRFKFVDLGPVVKLLNAGKPLLMVTGHVGNWEIMGYIMAVLGYPVHALYRPLDNHFVNDWLVGIRRRRGMHLITKWQASEQMQRVLAGGGVLGFIADQNAGKKGLFVPFFRTLASTYKSIGLLAITVEAPIVCGYAHRVGTAYQFELGVEDIIRPEDWQDRPDPLYYITARYMRAIERMVQRRPEQYLWSHRRWRSRPYFERQRNPMPIDLRKKLEQLPWIRQTDMERICSPDDWLASEGT